MTSETSRSSNLTHWRVTQRFTIPRENMPSVEYRSAANAVQLGIWDAVSYITICHNLPYHRITLQQWYSVNNSEVHDPFMLQECLYPMAIAIVGEDTHPVDGGPIFRLRWRVSPHNVYQVVEQPTSNT